MVRNYEFEWYNKDDVKYGGEPHIRHNYIRLSKPKGETAIDAKAALNIFCISFGSLKKNEIIRIKEFDENGQIGEDITPSEDFIVPVKK